MTYGSWSCAKEKVSIPLEKHASVERNFSKFSGKNLKELSFLYLLVNPAETAYLSFRDWGCGSIKSHNSFCLTSYPGEIAHSNSANQELSKDVLDMVVRQRKVALHTSSHLTPTVAWRNAVSTTSEGCRVSSEVRLEYCTQVLGVGQIWTA